MDRLHLGIAVGLVVTTGLSYLFPEVAPEIGFAGLAVNLVWLLEA